MQVKILLLATIGISSVLAGPLSLKAPKRNKTNVVLTQEGDGLCCYPDIENLKVCQNCRSSEKRNFATVTSSKSDNAVSKRARDGVPPDVVPPTLSWILTVKPPVLTSPAKAKAVTAMVGTSSQPKPQSKPTSTSTSTPSSDTGLPPCTKDGKPVPAKPLLEPWCSTANKNFQCQFCSHTLVSPVTPGDPLNEHLAEQDFEIWTVKETVGDIAMIVKEISDVQSRGKPCCIHGGLPEYNCDYCKGDGDPPSTPQKNTATPSAITPPLSQPPKRSRNDICCYFYDIQTCWSCAHDQKPPNVADSDVSVWARKNAFSGDLYQYEKVQDGSGTAVRKSEGQCCTGDFWPVCGPCPSTTQQPPAQTNKAVQGRDQNDLCCFTNGLQVFSCYLCNKSPPTDITGEISIWTRKQEIGGGIYQYELVQDGTSGATIGIIPNKCCAWIGYIPICFDCPSATSATEISPPAATADKLATRDSTDLCCFTNGLQVFGCHLCDKKPPAIVSTDDAKISVWKQGKAISDGVFEYEDVEAVNPIQARNSNRSCCSIMDSQEPVCYECPSPGNTATPHPPRQAPITTKVRATVTLPEPTLSFPATLPNLPEITPQSATAVEKRSEQGKCCLHYGVVLVCHPCSVEEEDMFEHVPQPPIIITQNKCCVHYDADLVCHDCPVGTANSAEYKEPSQAPSFVRRQQTYDFHITCNGMYQMAGANKLRCPKSKATISGATCQSFCHCDDLGSIQCDAPDGTSCTNDAMAKFCRLGSAYWGCACTHLPDHPHALDNTVPR